MLAIGAGEALASDRARPPAEPISTPAPADKAAALDALFARLKSAGSDEAAAPIVADIWQQWVRSGEAAVDLLMDRALVAMQTRDLGVALVILDEVVTMAPKFAEGWNRRATVLYLMNEPERSFKDCEQVLRLEPRHFGALAGMAMIHIGAGRLKEALAAYRRALEHNPYLLERHRIIPDLARRVEGQPL